MISGRIKLVIGARSALFLPFSNLKIIVVDEEHDSSFKQQEGFRYSARDLAIMRAKQENIPVVLGSATPSLESIYNVKQGRYQHCQLTHRANQAATLPTISCVDLRLGKASQGIAPVTQKIIGKHLQAIKPQRSVKKSNLSNLLLIIRR